jgi:hypothetical protein
MIVLLLSPYVQQNARGTNALSSLTLAKPVPHGELAHPI